MAARRRIPAGTRSIRSAYERHGVRAFYERSGARYRNPHEPAIRRVLEAAVAVWKPDLSSVLDLACGSGEATLVLRSLGAGAICGVDPYTATAYKARTGAAAECVSFADIAAGALAGRSYSLVVSSFALHLVDPSRLPLLGLQLCLIGESLLVVTPHKRPVLERAWGWELENELAIDRVRARFYRSTERSLTLSRAS